MHGCVYVGRVRRYMCMWICVHVEMSMHLYKDTCMNMYSFGGIRIWIKGYMFLLATNI